MSLHVELRPPRHRRVMNWLLEEPIRLVAAALVALAILTLTIARLSELQHRERCAAILALADTRADSLQGLIACEQIRAQRDAAVRPVQVYQTTP